ncbi:hypothetical protein OIU85_022742 [Salix viminalis]|uniref:Uncharacterized protein n=1 Tax=Salix viminalis TaxID=40686 RepID=A0A9Q0U7G9_SALVM|nr:hypothetical protein OIU85_022742 [Salix viminalis]
MDDFSPDQDIRLVSVLSFGASVTREQGSEFHVILTVATDKSSVKLLERSRSSECKVTVNSTVNGVASDDVNQLVPIVLQPAVSIISLVNGRLVQSTMGAFGCGRATLHVSITKTINYRMILLYDELPLKTSDFNGCLCAHRTIHRGHSVCSGPFTSSRR